MSPQEFSANWEGLHRSCRKPSYSNGRLCVGLPGVWVFCLLCRIARCTGLCRDHDSAVMVPEDLLLGSRVSVPLAGPGCSRALWTSCRRVFLGPSSSRLEMGHYPFWCTGFFVAGGRTAPRHRPALKDTKEADMWSQCRRVLVTGQRNTNGFWASCALRCVHIGNTSWCRSHRRSPR